MNNYSENEREFFRKLLFDFEIRMDGRDKLALRTYSFQDDVIPSALSSCRLLYNDYQNEMLIAVKGEIFHNKEETIAEKLITVNIESMHRIDDIKLKKETENYIDVLVLDKIPTDALKIVNNSNEYYWKIYIDIYLLDSLKLSLLQLISVGVKHVIKNIKPPKVVVFVNEVTGLKEYDIIENYEDVTNEEKQYSIKNFVFIPDLFVFALLNNALFLDPSEEEFSVSASIIIASAFHNEVLSVQSVGASVDIQKILDITSLIKSIT